MRRLDFGAAVVAGLVAGAVFLVLEMIMVPVFLDGSAWGPPRMMAAIILGQGVLPPPATFSLGIFIVALVLHFVLSIIYVMIAGLLAPASRLSAALLGGILGLVLYVVNFYGMTAVFPWFAMARNWVSIFAHIVFGVVAGWMYVSLVHSRHHEEVLLNRKLERTPTR